LWQDVLDADKGSALLQNLVDTVRYRRGLGEKILERKQYVISSRIEAQREEYKLFSRPTTVEPSDNGSFFVVAYGSNEILLFNANGGLQRRLRGGVQGFDHPFDILETEDGRLFVTEFEGDRITECTRDGYIVNTFGKTGRGDGGLVGPQYIASDSNGYLYVTDWGNRRVCKFDYDGNHILSFGEKTEFFEGITAPSGIIVENEKVFVTDSMKKCIFVFDLSGNYLDTLAKGQLEAPEDISAFKQGSFLIADTNKILRFEPEKDMVTTVTDLGGSGEKVLSAGLDSNETLIAVDFNREEIILLSELSNLYAGLTVMVDRIYEEEFPQVELSVTVQTRQGEPVVGLDKNNFVITEKYRPVTDLSLDFVANRSEFADIALVVEKSDKSRNYKQEINEAVAAVMESLGDRGDAALVAAEKEPMLEAELDNRVTAPLTGILNQGFVSDYRFDKAVRMAVSELIPSRNKKAVVFITTGELGEKPFGTYGLSEMLQYMNNNGISFYTIYLVQGKQTDELEYLCRESGGKSFYLYRPEGIEHIAETIINQESGLYVFSYSSMSESDFGRAYIPVEVEAFLFNKSGRDRSGYFSPLEF
jgi:DNA-binding beta-propeller fold protein YncE